jgi:hypothetical protein
MHSILKIWIAAAIILFSTSFAKAEGPKIAQIKTASGQVTIVRAGGNIPAKPGEFLYEKDTIQTGADGAIGITFTDNTVMSPQQRGCARGIPIRFQQLQRRDAHRHA